MFALPFVFLNLAILTTSVPIIRRGLPIDTTPSDATVILESLEVAMEDESIPYNRGFFPTWDKISESLTMSSSLPWNFGPSWATEIAMSAIIKIVVPFKENGRRPTTLGRFRSNLLDIDHLVPLKEGWISGANAWSDGERESFANDITNPELIAVSRRSNEAKGDQDPAKRLPANQAFQCDYVLAWIQVKKFYGLTIDAPEKAALEDALETC